MNNQQNPARVPQPHPRTRAASASSGTVPLTDEARPLSFDKAPAGLKPIGGVLAGIIAGLPVPQE